MRLIIGTLILFISFNSNAQLDSVRNILYEKLENHLSGEIWNIDILNPMVINISRMDTFSVCSGFNPIRGHRKPNTLFINFQLEQDWSFERIDSIDTYNMNILRLVVPQYITYYDSVGWGKARVKNSQLREQPKFSILQDWNKTNYLSESELLSLFKLKLIPDTLIGNIGVFHSRNFPPIYIIKPKSLENELDILLNKLKIDILPLNAILRNEGFYLKSPFEEGI